MSPAPLRLTTTAAVQATLDRMWAGFGARVRDERLSRQWTTQRLAEEAGVSRTLVYLVERGDATSLEACARLARALALTLELELITRRRRSTKAERAAEPVRSAMGELEAAHLRAMGLRVAIDEPYQHFQFAGRADLLAWPDGGGQLLHIENRTRFTDLQAVAGGFNAKRAYLARSVAERLGLGRLVCVTHVIVALWSSEVLHILRMRRETMRALCPDPVDAFEAWWSGQPLATGVTSSLIVFDPFSGPRQARFMGLDGASNARPRVSCYAEAARRVGLN